MRELEGNDVRFYKPWAAGDTENPDALNVHYGVIGCGQMLNREEVVRRDFAFDERHSGDRFRLPRGDGLRRGKQEGLVPRHQGSYRL